MHSLAMVLIELIVSVTEEGARPSKESELVVSEGLTD